MVQLGGEHKEGERWLGRFGRTFGGKIDWHEGGIIPETDDHGVGQKQWKTARFKFVVETKTVISTRLGGHSGQPGQ